MITFEEARLLVMEMLGVGSESADGAVSDLVLLEKETIEKSYGWVFFYQSSKYLRTRNDLDALFGNGPIVVTKKDARIIALGTALSPANEVAQFERREGLLGCAASTPARE